MTRYPIRLESYAIKFANEFLNETEAKRIEYVQEIRMHFKNNESTIHISDEDAVLVAFLRVCKYDLQRTIKKMKNYYIMRGQAPQIFTNRDPHIPLIQKLLAKGFIVPLRKFHNNQLVIVGRPSSYDPKEIPLEISFKLYFMILDICSRICPQIQVYGVCCLYDMQGVSIGHLQGLTHTLIKLLVKSWENHHCRPQQMVFMNVPWFINVVLNITRRFMSAKLKDRLHVDTEGSVVQFVDKSILPKELGGDDGAMEDHIRFWCEEVTRQKEWLKNDEQFGAKIE